MAGEGPPTGQGSETPDSGSQGPSAASRPPRRPPPGPLAVITVTLGIFLIALTLLAIQVRNGRDPALGPGPVVPAASAPQSSGGAASVKQATQIVSRTSPVPP